MKEKIKFIILLVGFIIVLVIAGFLLNTRNNTDKQTQSASQTNKQLIKNQITNNITIDSNVQKVEDEEIAIEVDNSNFEAEVMKSDKKVIIDFHALWCGPCKVLSPILEEVARENEDIKLVKIDVDQNSRLATAYGITAMPTLVIIENGKEVNRSIGVISKQQVLDLIGK